eukprot:2920940-Lingulodinium_polyedra.AAC.1
MPHPAPRPPRPAAQVARQRDELQLGHGIARRAARSLLRELCNTGLHKGRGRHGLNGLLLLLDLQTLSAG